MAEAGNENWCRVNRFTCQQLEQYLSLHWPFPDAVQCLFILLYQTCRNHLHDAKIINRIDLALYFSKHN